MKQQHEADLGDPKQRFAWALRGVEVRGMPMAIPEPVLEEISEHLSRAGAIHIDQVAQALAGEESGLAQRILSRLPKQEIHYQPPIRGQDHILNTSGEWKPVEEPIQEPLVPSADKMTPQEKAKMIAEFKEEGLIE